jgi:hypothetical protein
MQYSAVTHIECHGEIPLDAQVSCSHVMLQLRTITRDITGDWRNHHSILELESNLNDI